MQAMDLIDSLRYLTLPQESLTVFTSHVPAALDVLAPGPSPLDLHVEWLGADADLIGYELHAILANLHILAPALRSYFEVYNLPAFDAAFHRGIEGRPELEIR